MRALLLLGVVAAATVAPEPVCVAEDGDDSSCLLQLKTATSIQGDSCPEGAQNSRCCCPRAKLDKACCGDNHCDPVWESKKDCPHDCKADSFAQEDLHESLSYLASASMEHAEAPASDEDVKKLIGRLDKLGQAVKGFTDVATAAAAYCGGKGTESDKKYNGGGGGGGGGSQEETTTTTTKAASAHEYKTKAGWMYTKGYGGGSCPSKYPANRYNGKCSRLEKNYSRSQTKMAQIKKDLYKEAEEFCNADSKCVGWGIGSC